MGHDAHVADETNPHVMLTHRFGEAVTYAATLHRDQSRKDTSTPYMAHLLGAASFVLEQPGTTEDQAIAALLHDALEDQPDRTSAAEISDRFGPAVAQIVLDCTDAHSHPKPPWRHRKAAYLAHLETVADASLQVSLADKLHNARSITTDLAIHGDALWARFNAPPVAQRWYYAALSSTFSRRLGNETAHALAVTVAAMVEGIADHVRLDPDPDRPVWVGTDAITGAAADLADAARTIRTTPDQLRRHGDAAWRTDDGQWWVERVDAGDPARRLTIFVAPEPY